MQLVSRKKIFLILFVLVSNVYGATAYTFSCACAGVLNSAFNKIEKHIIDDNLKPIYNHLDSFNETIKRNTEVLEKEKPIIEKSNEVYKQKILEAKEYLFELKKETEILSKGEKNNIK